MKSFWDCLTETRPLTKTSLGILVTGTLFMMICIFVIMPYLKNNFNWIGYDEKCIVKCRDDECKWLPGGLRGSNYFNSTMQPVAELRKCAVTIWELSHLFLHVIIGYFYGMSYSIGIGVSWEIFEYFSCDCHSVYDFAHNITGGMIGTYLRYLRQV